MRSESWKFQEQATDAAEDEGPIEATTITRDGKGRKSRRRWTNGVNCQSGPEACCQEVFAADWRQ